jgi:bifunctional ADP-heptose synthase (sugar kinase/adenylyltransferase)
MDHRLEFVLNLKAVDMVFPFDTDEELEDLVKLHQPDIMMVGSDWKNKPVIGSEYAKELKFFDRIDEYSSTKIIQSIIDRG